MRAEAQTGMFIYEAKRSLLQHSPRSRAAYWLLPAAPQAWFSCFSQTSASWGQGAAPRGDSGSQLRPRDFKGLGTLHTQQANKRREK